MTELAHHRLRCSDFRQRFLQRCDVLLKLRRLAIIGSMLVDSFSITAVLSAPLSLLLLKVPYRSMPLFSRLGGGRVL